MWKRLQWPLRSQKTQHSSNYWRSMQVRQKNVISNCTLIWESTFLFTHISRNWINIKWWSCNKVWKMNYRVYHLKCNPTTVTYCGTKMNSEAGPPSCNWLPVSPMTLESRSHPLLGCYSSHLRKSFSGANVYSWAEHVFILEHYFSSKSFAAVRDAFSSAYHDKEVLNKTTPPTGNKILGHRICLSVTNAHRVTKQLKLWLYWFQVMHQLQQQDTAARI
jgi:hypothetical protein